MMLERRGDDMRRLLAMGLGVALLSGCGTINSYASGCVGLYSGVRQDADLLGAYGETLLIAREVPLGFDGWLSDAWDAIVVALDMPLSAVVDSVSAPIAWAVGPSAPEPMALGCRWSAPKRRWGSVARGDPDAIDPR
jgi:uncharacterized protein YceK